MAEFQVVARHWKRICKKYWRATTCHGCPIAEYEKRYEACSGYESDVEKMEELVMSWAAEHPEPVYPSIAKYLERFGIIIRRDGSLQADFFKANEPMSADMAKLLGISPGEGENEKTD